MQKSTIPIVTLVLAVVFALGADVQAQSPKSTSAAEGEEFSIAPPSPKAPEGAMPGPGYFEKIVEIRNKIDTLNQKILQRKEILYANNQDIRKKQDEMRRLQESINEILSADDEYSLLVIQRDVLFSTMPSWPSQHESPSAKSPQGGPDASTPPQ